MSSAEAALEPEVLWGTSFSERHLAKNVLSDEKEVSTQQEANFWLAEKEITDGQGFVMKVANSKRKIVGVKIRNTFNAGKSLWAAKGFQIEGSLLKEPGTLSQRTNPTWTPEILKEAGSWTVLLRGTLKTKSQDQSKPPLETFFFGATTELRYLWFNLNSYYGQGGGLQYLAPILQSGEI